MVLARATLALGEREHPFVGNAEIMKTEIAENGLVHIVDAVLWRAYGLTNHGSAR